MEIRWWSYEHVSLKFGRALDVSLCFVAREDLYVRGRSVVAQEPSLWKTLYGWSPRGNLTGAVVRIILGYQTTLAVCSLIVPLHLVYESGCKDPSGRWDLKLFDGDKGSVLEEAGGGG